MFLLVDLRRIKVELEWQTLLDTNFMTIKINNYHLSEVN
jgi:hypothetical protein